MTEVERRFRRVLVGYMGLNEEDITYFSNFRELGVDSLDDIELLVECEHEFGIDIPEQDIVSLTTVRDAVQYLQQRMDAKERT